MVQLGQASRVEVAVLRVGRGAQRDSVAQRRRSVDASGPVLGASSGSPSGAGSTAYGLAPGIAAKGVHGLVVEVREREATALVDVIVVAVVGRVGEAALGLTGARSLPATLIGVVRDPSKRTLSP